MLAMPLRPLHCLSPAPAPPKSPPTAAAAVPGATRPPGAARRAGAERRRRHPRSTTSSCSTATTTARNRRAGKLLHRSARACFAFKTGRPASIESVAVGRAARELSASIEARRHPTSANRLRSNCAWWATTPEERHDQAGKGGGLLLHGRANLPDGKPQRGADLAPQGRPMQKTLDPPRARWRPRRHQHRLCSAPTSPNVQAADAKKHRQHRGQAQRAHQHRREPLHRAGPVLCDSCDTPVVANNTFEYLAAQGAAPRRGHQRWRRPLAEIKGNTFAAFSLRHHCLRQTDCGRDGNTIEKCRRRHLLAVRHSERDDQEVRHPRLRDRHRARRASRATDRRRDVEGATTGYPHAERQPQLTNFQIEQPGQEGRSPCCTSAGTLTLLNCNVIADADQGRLRRQAGDRNQPYW